MTGGTEKIVKSLAEKCKASLRALSSASLPYALLDFPYYANVGDSAIWLGSRRLLKNHHGAQPAYVSTKMNFSVSQLNKALPEGPIYLLGGGNFGDLYPAHQKFRTHVVGHFGSRVVQLPQSLHFGSDEMFKQAKELAWLGMTLMVRDHASHETATRLGFEPKLVPDFALGLGSQTRLNEPDRDMLVLSRTDKESIGADAAGVDWNAEVPLTSVYAALRSTIAHKRFSRLHTFDTLAQIRVRRGLELLSLGKVVATDRLHGHILATLLGIPHFVSDNSTGKLTGYVDAWIPHSRLIEKRRDLSSISRADARALFIAWETGDT